MDRTLTEIVKDTPNDMVFEEFPGSFGSGKLPLGAEFGLYNIYLAHK